MANQEPAQMDIAAVFAALARGSYRDRRRFLRRKVRPSYPRYIYKFRRLDPDRADANRSLVDILVESRLWLSSPESFNDPFDMTARVIAQCDVATKKRKLSALLSEHRPNLDRNEHARELARMLALPDHHWGQLAVAAYDRQTRRAGVCSFAGDPRSVLMWSHYSSDHAGVCIQFEIAQNPVALLEAIRVTYDEAYPTVNWFADDFAEQLKTSLLRKHPNWGYEIERRIIRIGEGNTHLAFLPSAVTGVIVGCRASDRHRAVLAEILRERGRRGLPNVRLLRAEKHAARYALRLRRFAL